MEKMFNEFYATNEKNKIVSRMHNMQYVHDINEKFLYIENDEFYAVIIKYGENNYSKIIRYFNDDEMEMVFNFQCFEQILFTFEYFENDEFKTFICNYFNKNVSRETLETIDFDENDVPDEFKPDDVYGDYEPEYAIYDDVREMYYENSKINVATLKNDLDMFMGAMGLLNEITENIMCEISKIKHDEYIIAVNGDDTGYTIVFKCGDYYKYVDFALSDNDIYEICGYNTLGNLTANDINDYFDNAINIENEFVG